MKKKRRTRGNRSGKKVSYDGIKFDSGIERYAYMALKKAKLFEKYAEEKFELIEGFHFENESYERQANGKGEFRERGCGKKILAIRYTPDFTGRDFIIETKGYPNESFPMRFKLFKRRLMLDGDTRIVYKPQNKEEVDLTINLILNNRKNGNSKRNSR